MFKNLSKQKIKIHFALCGIWLLWGALLGYAEPILSCALSTILIIFAKPLAKMRGISISQGLYINRDTPPIFLTLAGFSVHILTFIWLVWI